MLLISFQGLDKLVDKYQKMGYNLDHIPPSAFEKIKDDLQSEFERVFDAEGPGWVKLSPFTVRAKQRAGYGGRGILVQTGKLKRSYTTDSPYSRWTITNTGISYENLVPYASKHEEGEGNIPARHVIAGILERKNVQEMVKKHLRDAILME